jgi:D,D-heptose 1,7-bisphosphate phosphatase
MYKAIFLDRDGIINKNRNDYVKSLNEFQILPSVPEAIRLLNKSNFKVIIISNQSAVNRGLITIEKLNKIHNFLSNYLLENNAMLDAIYFCPHKPDESCDCRKPKPGLILKAAKEHDINLENSIFIGDRLTDSQAAINAGVKPILMERDGDLLETVRNLLKKNE